MTCLWFAGTFGKPKCKVIRVRGFKFLQMKIFSHCINAFVGLLASVVVSLNLVENSFIQFHEHTQKDKGDHNSMYITQSPTGKTEGSMVVSSLMRAGPWEGERRPGHSWGRWR